LNWLGLSGPGIHIGASLALATLLRLNPLVLVFYGLLPDMVDKPLAVLGLGGSRYVGHTVLFGLVSVGALIIAKRSLWAPAIVGFTSHLLLDLNATVPWLYPFVDYSFPRERLDGIAWLRSYLTWRHSGMELALGVGLIAACYLVRIAVINLSARLATRWRRYAGHAAMSSEKGKAEGDSRGQ
jgi:hypothetical protein